MLSLSPRFDFFRFILPKDFLPEEVHDKWMEFFRRQPGVVQTPMDYLNESIKGISLPGISDINITQPQTSTNSITRQGPDRTSLGRINVEPIQENVYGGPANPLSRIERKFQVTFRLNQGLYNYFMLYETIFYRMCKPTLYDKGIDLRLEVLNESGQVVSTIKLFQCRMEGIDGLEFGYDKVDRQADTFNVGWSFNNIDFDFHIPKI